jgi:hypothetical protein
MSNKRMVLVLTGIAIAVVGLIVKSVDLGEADQIASVIGSLAAVVGLGFSVWCWIQGSRPGAGRHTRPVTGPGETPKPPWVADLAPPPWLPADVDAVKDQRDRLDDGPISDCDYRGLDVAERQVRLIADIKTRHYPGDNFSFKSARPEEQA